MRCIYGKQSSCNTAWITTKAGDICQIHLPLYVEKLEEILKQCHQSANSAALMSTNNQRCKHISKIIEITSPYLEVEIDE